METEKIINEIKEELSKKYKDFKGIYFFGSRAKNTYSENSDIDIVIIFNKEIDWRFEEEVLSIIYPFMLRYEVVIDTKVYSSTDIERPANYFRYNVKKEGVFYAA